MCFSVNFAKFLRTTFLQNNSADYFWLKHSVTVKIQKSLIWYVSVFIISKLWSSQTLQFKINDTLQWCIQKTVKHLWWSFFANIVNGFQSLSIFVKCSIFYVCLGSECPSSLGIKQTTPSFWYFVCCFLCLRKLMLRHVKSIWQIILKISQKSSFNDNWLLTIDGTTTT